EEAQRSMRDLAHSSLSRLRNWDISDAQIQALARSGETRRTLTFRSPVSGIVTEKKAVQGMRFEPGEMLYQIVDLSSVWVIADIFEQEIGALKAGAKAQVTLGAYPGRRFEGTMSYVYPTLTPESRTVAVRIELSNSDGALKPGMFAQVEIASGGNKPSLTVPSSAVIDSGTRTVVLVDLGEGRFEPREVKLGARTSQFAEIRAGLRDGELVVVAANFLIDAESNLKAAIGGFGHASHDAAQAPKQTEPPAQAVSHRGEGRIEEIDLPAKSITLDHGPIETLKWPAMTMPFEVANTALLQGLKPGQVVNFEFVQRGQGEWVITRITPKTPTQPLNAHGGH
ncbi:MAG TPA: efflux RND transporter periplasmic adaptor subunit, partial [Burkholderiales bacterium]|nr:efflux RND transporter periplasmic adaptor subunit [Burkholderiales bacterium]